MCIPLARERGVETYIGVLLMVQRYNPRKSLALFK